MSPWLWSISPRNHPSLPSLRFSEPFNESPFGEVFSGERDPKQSGLLLPAFLPPLPLLPGTAHPHCPPAGLDFLPSVETKGEIQVTEHGRRIFQSSGPKNRQATMDSAFQCLSGQEMMTSHSQQAQDAHDPLLLSASIAYEVNLLSIQVMTKTFCIKPVICRASLVAQMVKNRPTM